METTKALNICFVSNFTKTFIFDAVAKQLQKKYNCNIFWIVVNRKYKAFLEETYDQFRIFYKHKLPH